MIRPARLEDLPRLVELGAAMHDESPRFRVLALDRAKLATSIEIAMHAGFAMVGEVDGRIVGGMLAVIHEHWASRDKVACDLALFVEPEHRGGMLAARLLRAYSTWAQREGAKMVLFGVMSGVEPVKTACLSQAVGLVSAGIVMEVPQHVL